MPLERKPTMPEHSTQPPRPVTETEDAGQDIAALIEEVSIDGMCGVY